MTAVPAVTMATMGVVSTCGTFRRACDLDLGWSQLPVILKRTTNEGDPDPDRQQSELLEDADSHRIDIRIKGQVDRLGAYAPDEGGEDIQQKGGDSGASCQLSTEIRPANEEKEKRDPGDSRPMLEKHRENGDRQIRESRTQLSRCLKDALKCANLLQGFALSLVIR
jgi:hypothetical protein